MPISFFFLNEHEKDDKVTTSYCVSQLLPPAEVRHTCKAAHGTEFLDLVRIKTPMSLNQYVNQEYIDWSNSEKEANIPCSHWSCRKCQATYSELVPQQTQTADIWCHGKKVTREMDKI